jgi:hypothetical protein
LFSLLRIGTIFEIHEETEEENMMYEKEMREEWQKRKGEYSSSHDFRWFSEGWEAAIEAVRKSAEIHAERIYKNEMLANRTPHSWFMEFLDNMK